MKTCTKCKLEKSLDSFYLRNGKHITQCKSCVAARTKEYQLKNPDVAKRAKSKCNKKHKDKYNSYRNKYKQIHKFKTLAERANWHALRKSNNKKITALDLFSIAKKQKLICPVSGIKLNNNNISVDHIIPFASGGENVIENIRLVDWDINRMKNSHSEQEFFEIIKRIYIHNFTSQPQPLSPVSGCSRSPV